MGIPGLQARSSGHSERDWMDYFVKLVYVYRDILALDLSPLLLHNLWLKYEGVDLILQPFLPGMLQYYIESDQPQPSTTSIQ